MIKKIKTYSIGYRDGKTNQVGTQVEGDDQKDENYIDVAANTREVTSFLVWAYKKRENQKNIEKGKIQKIEKRKIQKNNQKKREKRICFQQSWTKYASFVFTLFLILSNT